MPFAGVLQVDERLRFVARLLDGRKMATLCREFDISRKTGYKIFQRYKDCGVVGSTAAADAPTGMPTGCRFRSRRSSSSSSVSGRAGAHRRSANGCAGGIVISHKGEFMLANRQYCYPLTITDFASRYLLACEGLSTTQEIYACTVFEGMFREFEPKVSPV